MLSNGEGAITIMSGDIEKSSLGFNGRFYLSILLNIYYEVFRCMRNLGDIEEQELWNYAVLINFS